MTHPENYTIISYNLPPSYFSVGTLLDLTPNDPHDQRGAQILLPSCQTGRVPFGTLTVINFSGPGGGPTEFLVKRSTRPPDFNHPCAAAILCDSPDFTRLCVRPCVFEADGEAIVARLALNTPGCTGPAPCTADCPDQPIVQLEVPDHTLFCPRGPAQFTATATNASSAPADIDIFFDHALAGTFPGVVPGGSVSVPLAVATCPLELPVAAVARNAACPDPIAVEKMVKFFCGPDRHPPVITCPGDLTVECSAPGGVPKTDPAIAAFLASVDVSDECDASVALTNHAPEVFGLGHTSVTFIAGDDAGRVATCAANVHVVDTTKPVLSVSLSRDVLWPPNHKLSTVTVTVDVADECATQPQVRLTSVRSDEPDNGQGDGDTDDDIQGEDIGTQDVEFQLRSERAGGLDGRTYSIVYTATDAAGNATEVTLQVSVPHDRSGIALGSTGFLSDGRGLYPRASRYFLVVLARDAPFDVLDIDPRRAAIGNRLGVIRAVSAQVLDVDGDQRGDLALEFSGPETRALAAAAAAIGEPLGCRYETRDGVGYVVGDIFALGNPVPLPRSGATRPSQTFAKGSPESGGLSTLPEKTAFVGIRPNPFNPVTIVSFQLASADWVRLDVYTLHGHLVRRLVTRSLPAGRNEATWDGTDASGRPVPSGDYNSRMQTSSLVETRKAVVMK